MTTRTVLLAIAVVAGAATLGAGPQSYFVRTYDFSSLKTWRFDPRPRAADDVLAYNHAWADMLHHHVIESLVQCGFNPAATDPDFLVGISLVLTDGGRGRQHRPAWPGGWPAGGGWEVPASAATLAIAIIDAPTDALVWRGMDTRTIDIERPDHTFDKAVDTLVRRFMDDVARAQTLPAR